MDSWRSENNPAKQTALSIGFLLIGLVLAIGFRNFTGTGMTNSLAGFLLGILLLIIGLWGLLVTGKQTIVADPKTRSITIEDSTLFRKKKRIIPFGDIADIRIGYLGKKSNFVEFYYLILKLRDGEEYPLFSPGRFHEGTSDRAVMEERRQRLEQYLRQ